MKANTWVVLWDSFPSILRSYQQSVRVPLSPRPCQQNVLSVIPFHLCQPDGWEMALLWRLFPVAGAQNPQVLAICSIFTSRFGFSPWGNYFVSSSLLFSFWSLLCLALPAQQPPPATAPSPAPAPPLQPWPPRACRGRWVKKTLVFSSGFR